jgi:hypothetical protein
MADRARPFGAVSLAIFKGTRRLAWCTKRAAEYMCVLHGLQASWLVHTRRRNIMDTIHDRGDRHMAHKGRGIFLVYVDIDAQHDKEFNEW